MYMEEGSFAKFERVIDGQIPLTILKPIAHDLHQDVLIVYGGSTRPEFRKVVKKTWGEELAHQGFTVFCFDFRSNVAGNDFYQFGLWDRMLDTQRVLRFLASRPNRSPLAVIGVSMGGYIVAYLASVWGCYATKLVLVAPAAYHDNAIQPGIKFGEGKEGQPGFQDILRNPTKPYQASSIFRSVEHITDDLLVIAYEDDEIVKENPKVYLKHVIVRRPLRLSLGCPDQRIKFISLPGGHVGSFEDPERVKLLLPLFTDFLTS